LKKSIIFLIVGFLLGSSIPLLSLTYAESESLIPEWIKNTARFWVEGNVSDSEFINALQYMIKNGIIEIPEDESSLDCQNDSGDCFSSTISRIVDGDTIHDGSGNSIRLVLVNSPEMNTDEGIESKKYLESICPVGSIIHVDEDDNQLEGSHGRMIAKVYCEGDIQSLNEKIIENNHGTIYQRFCNVSEFGEEDWAIKHGC